jgi:hypothetical protein
LATILLQACDAIDAWFSPSEASAHAEYVEGLSAAGLAATPVARAWIDAGDGALERAETVSLPVRLDGWFDTESPTAVSLRFPSPDERWVTVRARIGGVAATRLFIDAFRLPRDTARAPRVLASAGDSARVLSFRVRGEDDVLVRIQPELLRGGEWELEVTASDDEPVAPGGSR